MDVLLLMECLDIQWELHSSCWYYRIQGGRVGMFLAVVGVQASSESLDPLDMNDTCLSLPDLCHDNAYSKGFENILILTKWCFNCELSIHTNGSS